MRPLQDKWPGDNDNDNDVGDRQQSPMATRPPPDNDEDEASAGQMACGRQQQRQCGGWLMKMT